MFSLALVMRGAGVAQTETCLCRVSIHLHNHSQMVFSEQKAFLRVLVSMLLKLPWNTSLLPIMCGYQCDKAVTKNDTREVI